ncbi:putative uncharacterized protein [Clostridium sp. CAG:1024]|nr:putative uncharacterized protein [Clostridium sp. CAG:1024]
MFLHIGDNVSIPLSSIVCVLNAAGLSESTAAYIARAKQRKRFRACKGALKCYLIVNEHGLEYVYASPISSSTLERRWKSELHHDWIRECAALTILED